LQQEEQLTPLHFSQELQVVLQQLLQALSAAVAVASPRPAMMASMAPALISVFMFLFCLLRAGIIPVLEVIHRTSQNPPEYFRGA
jgi:hypothetical protein